MGLSSSKPVDGAPRVQTSAVSQNEAGATGSAAARGVGAAASSLAPHPASTEAQTGRAEASQGSETPAARPFYAPVADLFVAIGNLVSRFIDWLFCRNAGDSSAAPKETIPPATDQTAPSEPKAAAETEQKENA
jgi:hypothetical protein